MRTIKTGARALLLIATSATGSQQPVYESGGVAYPYSTESTGETYTFEFEKNPGQEGERLKAALHVLQKVYDDDSIDRKYGEVFMKEGAKCYVFEARFYSYRTCFLPNDYFPDKKDRFWGFVSRLPNSLWFITRHGIPALLVVGGLYWVFRKR